MTILRQIKRRLGIEKASPPNQIWVPPEAQVFSGDYVSWEAAAKECGGYAEDSVLEKVGAAALAVRDGFALFERDSVLFHEPDYSWQLLAGLNLQAARDRGRLSVLDFGGSLGSAYFQCKRLLAPLPSVQWSIVEQPKYVEFGKKELASEELQFFGTVTDCLKERRPNVLLLGSVLQYLPNPFEFLDEVLRHLFPMVIVDRTAFLGAEPNRLTVQRVPKEIYEASYPAWFFNEPSFKRSFEQAGYDFQAEWKSNDLYPLGQIETFFKGFLFTQRI